MSSRLISFHSFRVPTTFLASASYLARPREVAIEPRGGSAGLNASAVEAWATPPNCVRTGPKGRHERERMNQNCRRCHHLEAEHHALGCTHWNTIETRTEDADGLTVHTDSTKCGCTYFRGALK